MADHDCKCECGGGGLVPVFMPLGKICGGGSGGPNYVGKIDFTFYDPADVAANLPGWIFMGGGLYPLDSAEGRALNSLPDKFKQNAGIVSDGVNINAPKMFYSDGRGYFVRAADGVNNAIGSVRTDKIRNITGSFGHAMGRCITGAETTHPSGALGPSTGAILKAAGGSGSAPYCNSFDASRVVPTGAENEPININLTPIMYLGV